MFYDEAYERPGTPRAHYSGLLKALDGRDLGDLGAEVAQAAEERGIAFGEEPDGAFLVDPVPRLITADEWRGLEAGLVQRVRALDAFVARRLRRAADRRGGRRARATSSKSAEYHEPALAGNDLSRRPCHHRRPGHRARPRRALPRPRGQRPHARRGWPTSSRRASSTDARGCRAAVPARHGVDGAFALLGETLRAARARRSGRTRLVAVLTDGPANTAWWEHRTIADPPRACALVGVADLVVADDGLYAQDRR